MPSAATQDAPRPSVPALEPADGVAPTPVAADGLVDVGALFDQHAPFLHRVVSRLAGPGDHVEDVVQETFLTAHRRRADLDTSTDLRGWLYRTASNLVMHHRRSFARRRRLSDAASDAVGGPDAPAPSGHDAPDTLLDRRRRAARVHTVIAKLSHTQREAFVLYELEGLEGQAIAELLGVPLGTVWTRLHHARKRFAQLWGDAPTA